MKPRFTIYITHYFWSCGDGCCSDSDYKIEIIDSTPTIPGRTIAYKNNNWDFNRDKQVLIEEGVEQIKKIINREPFHNQDYSLHFDTSD